jgi:hypothetical protein
MLFHIGTAVAKHRVRTKKHKHYTHLACPASEAHANLSTIVFIGCLHMLVFSLCRPLCSHILSCCPCRTCLLVQFLEASEERRPTQDTVGRVADQLTVCMMNLTMDVTQEQLTKRFTEFGGNPDDAPAL